MRKLALVVALLLLVGCGQQTSALPGNGVVVDCAAIATIETGSDAAPLKSRGAQQIRFDHARCDDADYDALITPDRR